MEHVTYSNFRNHLTAILDRVNEDHIPMLITRQSGKPAVVMALDDFKAYEATAYLMSSIKNAETLNRAIEQLENGQGKQQDLIEE